MTEPRGTTRVVLADESDTSGAFLAHLLESDPQIHVVARAASGAELIALPERSCAEVIVLDARLPHVGGMSIVRRLATDAVVIAVGSDECSSREAEEMLLQGATAFFYKRDLASPSVAERLRSLLKTERRSALVPRSRSVILVVGSTGAVAPLELLIRDLTGVIVPIVVVQHMPEGREHSLARLLAMGGHVVEVARRGDSLGAAVLIAPGGHHLALDARGRVELLDTAPVQGHRPSGDVLLRSAIPLGSRVIAIMLSGLGDDGARAMGELADAGATCLTQHPGEAAADSMPRAALQASNRVRSIRTALLGEMVRKQLCGT